MEKSSIEAVSDALSDNSRRERRTLLGLSVLCIAVTHANLIPSKISAFGNDFSEFDQSALLGVLALVIVYFTIAFVIYASADLVAWRLRFSSLAEQDTDKARQRQMEFNSGSGYEDHENAERYLSKEERDGYAKQYQRYYAERRAALKAAPHISITRAAFDFVLPVAVGVYSIYELLAFR